MAAANGIALQEIDIPIGTFGGTVDLAGGLNIQELGAPGSYASVVDLAGGMVVGGIGDMIFYARTEEGMGKIVRTVPLLVRSGLFIND